MADLRQRITQIRAGISPAVMENHTTLPSILDNMNTLVGYIENGDASSSKYQVGEILSAFEILIRELTPPAAAVNGQAGGRGKGKGSRKGKGGRKGKKHQTRRR
jgi:hypothetical protein